MSACDEMLSVRSMKPASFVSKPGEYACTSTFGRQRPVCFDNIALPDQPLSDVRVGSNSTCPASGRWKQRDDDSCVSAIASLLPETRVPDASHSKIQLVLR